MPMPDGKKFKDISDHELLTYCGDDARKWAEAFCEHAWGHGAKIDQEAMTTWFANAIEHSWDLRCKREDS